MPPEWSSRLETALVGLDYNDAILLVDEVGLSINRKRTDRVALDEQLPVVSQAVCGAAE